MLARVSTPVVLPGAAAGRTLAAKVVPRLTSVDNDIMMSQPSAVA
jgi:hypothetical protein